MEIQEIISKLRSEKKLSEADASGQVHAMLATVRSRHPRLEITAVVFEGLATALCLKNGTRVIFDPSFPVPIWRYHKGVRSTNPKHQCFPILRILKRIDGLQEKALHAREETERQEAQDIINDILKMHCADSVVELEYRIYNADIAELGGCH